MAFQKVKDSFDSLSIPWEALEHESVQTIEAGLKGVGPLEALFAKNLFVRDKKAGLFLLTVPHDRKVDLKNLPQLLGRSGANFRFADTTLLKDKLGVLQGAVSPLAVMNDMDASVTLVLDQELMAASKVGLHPLQNDITCAISPSDLRRFVEAHDHKPVVVDFGNAVIGDIAAAPLASHPKKQAIARAVLIPHPTHPERGISGTVSRLAGTQASGKGRGKEGGRRR